MRIAMFYHSLVSDWNHGNAHFLRGIVSELLARGHHVQVYEPVDGWSRANLEREHGREPLRQFKAVYPGLRPSFYHPELLDLDEALADVDLVLVHECNEHELVRRIGRHRARRGQYRLLFHDTHHRSVSDAGGMAKYDLSHYDGVLAFGEVIRQIYLHKRWARRAWTWHEAADVRVFRPIPRRTPDRGAGKSKGDLVWIGNWGDDERTAELEEFLIEPVKTLGLSARVYGVRYPAEARAALERAGIEYRGWLPNYLAPQVFSQYRVTVHVPRRPYVKALPGIPTIRVFEALACGIPLICAPWEDRERLFRAGKDYLTARDGAQMRRQLKNVLAHNQVARELAVHGRQTILQRHTCGHRVDELLRLCQQMELGADAASAGALVV